MSRRILALASGWAVVVTVVFAAPAPVRAQVGTRKPTPQVGAGTSSTCSAGPAQYAPNWNGVYNFSLTTGGPRRVIRGQDLYVDINAKLLAGVRDYAFYEVRGLPPGATVSYPDLEQYCCGGNKGWQPDVTLLRISLAPSATAGSYALLVRAASGGLTREVCHNVVIEAAPATLPRYPITSVPPIPQLRLSEWESNMQQYGQTYCKPGAGIWDGNAWYYDGIRVYYQIGDYTRSAAWNSCASYIKDDYRPYVLTNKGGVPGYKVFPHGLYEDFGRTGDAQSKSAAILLAKNSAYAGKAGGVSPALSRETAYLIHAYRVAHAFGEPTDQLLRRAVDFSLGHIDQWFVSKTEPYLQPFMVALTSEALIQYYEETKDPRVPPAIKTAMDGIWDRAWVARDEAFFYESTGDRFKGAPDLNLLIAPAFAWLYSMTGVPLYQQRADVIFEGGVKKAWLGGGKQFSQNYRWSFDYVQWRRFPAAGRAGTPKTGSRD